MHIVREIAVDNFRSIKEGSFSLSAYTPFVGYNNAGKSNILRAVSWLIKKSALQHADFNSLDLPVVISGLISGVSDAVLENLEEKHRNKIKPFIANEKIGLRRIQTVPGASTSDIILEIQKTDGSGEWVRNPTGIDNAIAALFPQPIILGAMQDAAADVAKFGKSTTIGQLLSEIVEPIRAKQSAAIDAALAGIRETLSSNGINKDESLVEIDKMMEAEIGKFFPGILVKTHIPVPEFDDFLKGGTIKVFEGGGNENPEGRAFDMMGHGSQRAIQMALINCLSRIKNDAEPGTPKTTLLLIDEPELYLHPQAIERIRVALKSLTANGYQVLFSTHSANMIAREDAGNVVFVRKTTEQGTYCRPTIMETVKAEIEGADHQAELLFSLTHSSKILFADQVILSEGKTEHRIFPEIYANYTKATLEEAKTALVGVDGSSNIPAAMKILKAMALPVKAIVDLDFAFKVAPRHGLIDPELAEVIECRRILEDMQKRGLLSLGDDGYPKSNPGQSAAKAFEEFAKEPDALAPIAVLHEQLKQQGIWLWKRGAIEPHLGLANKTPGAWSKFLQDLENYPAAEFMSDPPSVASLCDWLNDN